MNDASNTSTPLNRAMAAYELNQLEVALAQANNALAASPNDPNPHLLLAQIHARRGDVCGLLVEAVEVCRLAPNHDAGHRFVGWGWLLVACQELRDSIPLPESRPPLLAARTAADSAISLGPNEPDNYVLATVIALAERDHQRAKQCVESGLELWPDHAPLLRLRAKSFLATGQCELALQSALDVARLEPNASLTHSLLAKVGLARGDFDQVVWHAHEMKRLDPTGTHTEQKFSRMLGTVQASRRLTGALKRYFSSNLRRYPLLVSCLILAIAAFSVGLVYLLVVTKS